MLAYRLQEAVCGWSFACGQSHDITLIVWKRAGLGIIW